MTHPSRFPSCRLLAFSAATLGALFACRASTGEQKPASVEVRVVDGGAAGSRSSRGAEASAPVAPASSAHERNASAAYSRALALEREDAYYEAVDVYDTLLSASPGYRDAALRRTTLIAFIELAEDQYAAALKARSTEDELVHLRLIRSFWPTFEDVGERMRSAVRAREGSALELER